MYWCLYILKSDTNPAALLSRRTYQLNKHNGADKNIPRVSENLQKFPKVCKYL